MRTGRTVAINLNPEVDTGREDDPMCFEPLALWKFNFAEVGFRTRKPLKAWALTLQLRDSGLRFRIRRWSPPPVFFERFLREAEIGRGVMKVMADHDRSQVYMIME